MSTHRSIWPVGVGITDADLDTQATASASAGDLALVSLATLGAALKRITPLDEETLTIAPHRLAYPGSGGDLGRVLVRRCTFTAAVEDGAGFVPDISLNHTGNGTLKTAQIQSNSSGLTRWDLVYATVQFTADAPLSRRYKDVLTGERATADFVVGETPTVALSVLSSAVSLASALAALPADASGAYNFPVAVVVVANGFTAGNAIAFDASGGTTYITQQWVGGGIHPSRIRARAGSIFSGSDPGKVSTPVSERTVSEQTWMVDFKHATNPQTILLDNTINWLRRTIRVHGARAFIDAGDYLAAELVDTAGSSVTFQGKGYTGAGVGVDTAVSITLPGAGLSGATLLMNFYADTDGSLKVAITGAPAGAAGYDNYRCDVTTQGQFWRNA